MRNFNEFAEVENLHFKFRDLFHRVPLGIRYLRLLRKAQVSKNPIIRYYYDKRRAYLGEKHNIEIFKECKIGKGLYLGHVGGVTVNPHAIIGEYCCLHKGCTIGVENRGYRKGCPIIGNCVWVGINSIIFGKIKIGDDVLISPNTVVNIDVPSHSVVFGNPCVVKHKEYATEGYISKEIYNKYFGNEEKACDKL